MDATGSTRALADQIVAWQMHAGWMLFQVACVCLTVMVPSRFPASQEEIQGKKWQIAKICLDSEVKEIVILM